MGSLQALLHQFSQVWVIDSALLSALRKRAEILASRCLRRKISDMANWCIEGGELLGHQAVDKPSGRNSPAFGLGWQPSPQLVWSTCLPKLSPLTLWLLTSWKGLKMAHQAATSPEEGWEVPQNHIRGGPWRLALLDLLQGTCFSRGVRLDDPQRSLSIPMPL